MTEIKSIASYVLYGLAFAIIAGNVMLKYLSWRDGKYRSWIYAVATILALIATILLTRNWWLLLVIVAADWLPPLFLEKRKS